MVPIKPLTRKQQKIFDEYYANQNLFLDGIAGSGKTFIALYLALEEVLSGLSTKNKVIVVRSAVPSRDIGFLPGNLKEKAKEYETAYMALCSELFSRGDAYQILKGKNLFEFMTTSYVRGLTLKDAILIIDEIQNFTFQESSSVLTRVGKNTRVIISGDVDQSDLKSNDDFYRLKQILNTMKSFTSIYFSHSDIVRSGFCKEFLVTKTFVETGLWPSHIKNSSITNSFQHHHLPA